MTVRIKSLADGQLADAKASMYTVAAATQAVVTKITLVSKEASTTRAVNLYFKESGGTSRNIIPVDTALKAGYLLVMDDEVTLEAGDMIEGDAAVADMIDYVVSGYENV